MSKNLPVTFTPIAACLNCDHQLEPIAHYCMNCGSKIQQKRFTFRRMLEEISHNFFNLDASLFKTFIDLFRRPETVIGGYLSGLRKRYLNAFSYMAITILLSGLQNILIKRYFPEVLDQISPDEGAKAMNAFLLDNSALVLYAFIPVLALMAWLVFYTLRKHNYMEQAIVQMYTYSHVSLVISIVGTLWLLTGLNYMYMAYGSQLLYILYNIYVYKRLYKLSNSGIFLRTLFFIGLLLIVLIIIGILWIIYFIMNPEMVKEFAPQQ